MGFIQSVLGEASQRGGYLCTWRCRLCSLSGRGPSRAGYSPTSADTKTTCDEGDRRTRPTEMPRGLLTRSIGATYVLTTQRRLATTSGSTVQSGLPPTLHYDNQHEPSCENDHTNEKSNSDPSTAVARRAALRRGRCCTTRATRTGTTSAADRSCR